MWRKDSGEKNTLVFFVSGWIIHAIGYTVFISDTSVSAFGRVHTVLETVSVFSEWVSLDGRDQD